MNRFSKQENHVIEHAEDIIVSAGMQKEREFRHHRNENVFRHSVGVACVSLFLAEFLRLRIDRASLIRGALLHDYFLYDWRTSEKECRPHGFKHAKFALRNAIRDFSVNEVERDIIEKHMFPLTIRLPHYKESVIVCLADKFCAVCEFTSYDYMKGSSRLEEFFSEYCETNSDSRTGEFFPEYADIEQA